MSDRSRPILVRCGAVLLVTALCTGCYAVPARSGDGEAVGFVVTQVPVRDPLEPVPDRLSLDARYPTGSRLLLVPAEVEGAEPRLLSGKLVAAGAPALSPDGRSVLFVGRRTPKAAWALFEIGIRSSKPRRLFELERDCSDPAYLPQGRLVFACAIDAETGASWSLYAASLEGGDVERITFGPGSAFDPVPLRDGRILFSMQQGPGKGRPAGGATALFLLNPDGSLLEPLWGSHRPPALKFRSRPTSDGGVVYLATDDDRRRARIQRIELSRPQAGPTTLAPALPSVSEAATAIALDPDSVEPLADGGYLISGRPRVAEGAQSPTSGVYHASPDGSLDRVFDTAEWDEVEAIPLVATPPPRGRPSGLHAGKRTGTLICYDAGRTDGQVGPPAGSRPQKVEVQLLEDRGDTAASGPLEIGEVPVFPDGSFFIEVPADLPIRLRSLDVDGAVMATSEWFWLRPGEVRACFGCHENREAAPVNRVVEALAQPPLSVTDSQKDALR